MDEGQKRGGLLARNVVRRIGDAGERYSSRVEFQPFACTRDRIVPSLQNRIEGAHRPGPIAGPLVARQVAHGNHCRTHYSLFV